MAEKPTALFEVSRKPFRPRTARESAEMARAARLLRDDWKPSRFNVAVDLPRKRKAVYNTFTGAIVILTEPEWRRSLAPASKCSADPLSEGLQTLHAKGFLVSAGVDEEEMVRIHYQTMRHSTEAFGVNLLCTLACNLRCPYCFQGKIQADGACRTMSRETEKAVIAWLRRSIVGRKRLELSWFGGEPLLMPGAMERVSAQLIPACAKAGVKYQATLVTNATLLDHRLIERLPGWNIGIIQATVDVPRSSKQDLQGRDTLETVLDRLRAAAGKAEVHLRINLWGDDEKEFDHLYRAMIRRGLHRKLKELRIAHVFAPERGRKGSTRTVGNRAYVAIVGREFAKAKALGLPVKRFFMSSRSEGCTATRAASVAIGPDGLLYKCVEDVGLTDRAFGSVLLEGYVKPANLVPWLTYDWFQHARCRSCPVAPQCAGGCPHKRRFQSNSLKTDDFCYWDIRGDLEEKIRAYARAWLKRTS